MRRFLKWTAAIVVILAVAGFVAFLYLIPPFTLIAPEEFVKGEAQAAPSMSGISDPAERALAERGKYIAVLAYLRHLKPAAHAVPNPTPAPTLSNAGAVEQMYFGADYAAKK